MIVYRFGGINMIVRDCHFRTILNKMCFIESELNRVLLEEFPSVEEVNGFVGYGYIDHQAGFTFETMACAIKNEKGITVLPGNDFMTFKQRMRHVMGKEVTILDEKDYDSSFFSKKIEKIENLYNGDVEIAALREIEEIDHLRSNEFTDDALVMMYKEGVNPEKAWFRLEGLNETYIQGRLLHELSKKEYGLHEGDVCNLSLMQDDNDTIHIICML